ncbi:hypothetical protein D9M69_711490 [compost metagenome]
MVGRRDTGGEVAGGDISGQPLSRELFRAKADHQRAGSRHHVHDALDRIGFERRKQRQRLVEIGEFDQKGRQVDGKEAHRILRCDRRCRECR